MGEEVEMKIASVTVEQGLATEVGAGRGPGASEMWTRALNTGICGSDLHTLPLGCVPRATVLDHQVGGSDAAQDAA